MSSSSAPMDRPKHNNRSARHTGTGQQRFLSTAEDYLTPGWILLFATFAVMAAIFFLFTPYTHQLDEIKNYLFMILPPFLLLGAVALADFQRVSWRREPATLFLAAWIIAMWVSFAYNGHKEIGERTVWFQVSAATFTAIFAWFMTTERKIRAVMLFMVVVAFLSCVLGLFFFTGSKMGLNSILESMLKSTYWQRQNSEWINLVSTLVTSRDMYSTILNQDFYAAYLVMTLPIALSMFFVEEHLGLKIMAIVTFLLMLVCLAFTLSNDSFMSVTLVTTPVFLHCAFRYVRGWNISKVELVVFGVGLLFLAINVGTMLFPQLANVWQFKTEAISGRTILWGGGFWPWIYGDNRERDTIDFMRLLIGVGPGGYRFYFPIFRSPDYFDNQINNVTTFAHNWYIDVVLEYGIFGLIAFMGLYIVVLGQAFRQVRISTNRTCQYYQLALLAGLAGISLQNFFSPNNRWTVCAMIFWALIGMSMGVRNAERSRASAPLTSTQPDEPETPRHHQNAGFARGLLVVFALLFVLRSTFALGWNHFESAKAHALGQRYMDQADAPQFQQFKDRLLAESRLQYERAITLNKTNVSSYYKVAHVYNQLSILAGSDREKYLEMMNKATQSYKDLQEICPNYSELHLNLGIMYATMASSLEGTSRTETLDESLVYMHEAVRQSLKPTVNWTAGLIGLNTAYENFRASLSDESEDVKIKTLEKSFAALELSKTFFRNIVTYSPRTDEYKMEKARVFERALDNLVKLAYATHDSVTGEFAMAKLLERNPDNTFILDGYLGLLDKKRRMDYLTTATEAAPFDFGLRVRMADALRNSGDLAGFERELLKAEILEPKNRIALERLYSFYKSKNNAAQMAVYASKLRDIGGNPDQVTTETMVSNLAEGQAAMRLVVNEVLSKKPEAQQQPDEFTILRTLESLKGRAMGVAGVPAASRVATAPPPTALTTTPTASTERIGQETTDAAKPNLTTTATDTVTSPAS